MSLQFSAQSKDRQSIERPPCELVQTVQHAEANSGAAAQTARARNFFCSRTRKCKAPAVRSLKEKVRGSGHDRREQFTFGRAGHGHKIVNAKRDAQAIETRSKIGSARGNTDRDAVNACHV